MTKYKNADNIRNIKQNPKNVLNRYNKRDCCLAPGLPWQPSAQAQTRKYGATVRLCLLRESERLLNFRKLPK